MSKISNFKKALISLIVIVLLLGFLIVNYTINYKTNDSVNISEVTINTKKVNSNNKVVTKKDVTKKEEEPEETNVISSFDSVRYTINYKLSSKDDIKSDAIIDVIISDEDAKYVSIKEINNDNITSKKTENGGLEILVKNVETNKDHSLVIEVDINNAPSEYKFSPKISVKSKNGEAIVKEPTVVEVSTTSLEGVLLNKDSGAEAPGVEIVLCRIDNDICVEKRSAITDQKGYYVIGDLKDGDYKVTLPEEYEFENNTIPITSGRNVVNISVENKGKFQASVKKYLEKVVVNGKEYNFDKKQKVQIPIITKSDVEATYLFEIKNDSRVDGYIKSIKENLPKEFVLSEDFEENKNWKENNGSYYNTTLKNDKITSGDTREVRIKIESKEKINPNQYINKVEIFGESYHTIKYIIDNNVYREFTISDDDKIDDLPYEKEGYTFEGWFIDKSYKNSYDFSKKVKSDLILYGKLKRNNPPKRTVTYMEDDTTVFDEKEVDDGECAEDIPGPEKEGYTFNYWKKDGVKYFNEITCEPVTEDIILYSDFDINKYKVKYYIPGELSDNNDHYNYTGAFNLYNDFTQEVEYKSFASNPGSVDIKYFNFKGWYKEESLTTKVEFPLEIKNATDIYGKYDIKKYNVEFYNDRGDTEPFLETTITATTIFNEPESEVPENYKIKEWQFENGDKVTYGDIAYNVLENRVVTEDDVIKVYRVLEGIKYKVRYIDYNNELIDENAEEILEFTESPEKLGDYAAIVSTPGHREGYVFDNFYYKNKAINEWDYTLFSDLCETKDNCVIDLIANYTEETEAPIYMVFFDKMNGASFETPKGEVFDKEKIPAYSGIGGPWTSIGSPSRYVPLGWYQVYTENGSPKSGPNGYLHYDTPFDFDNTVINETTFVTAEYKPYKYILRFNKTSDMQGEMPDQEIEFSSSNYSYNPYSTPQEKINVTINQNQFTYNGRYFTGWKSDITGDSIISSSPYSTFNVLQFEDDDHKIADGVYLLNLYPQFQEKSYYVEYNKNTGEGSMSSDSFTESDATGRTLKTNTFTKTGYKFSGWSLESGNNKEIVYSNEEPLNNVMNKMDELNTDYQTIYAQFVPNNYTIVFDKPEGVEGTMENQIMTYDISSNLSKNLYTKEGNEFKGWKNGNITYTDEQEVVNLTTEEEEIHLTPIFEPNKFTVTFIDKDEVYATITDVEYNSLINKPNSDPTKEHNKFLGWKVNGEENLFDFANTTVKSDLILVSVYEEIPTPSISHTPTEWTNDKVTVTITGNDNYDILYKVDEGLYQDYNDSFDISENSTIKAKNVVKVNDETIAESAEVSHIIDNIDKENPSIGADSVVPNTTSVDFNVSLTDELSGIKNVKLVINVQDEEKEYCSLENEIVKSTVDGKITGPKQYFYSCNVDELSENTEYTGKLITTDVAGNRNEKNINFSTSDNDIVARIIAYDDTTLEEENYINHPSLASALRDCETVSTTGYCVIQMVKSTRESVTVKTTQDIVLDLNGETVTGLNETTITNNGKLQIIDNNNSVDDETSEINYEPIGRIINNHVYTQNIEGVDTLVNDGIAILNNENATLTIGNNEVSSEEEGAVVSKVEPYIEGSFRGVSTYSDNTTFNFYDGVIKGGSNPIYGMVNDTPFMHNVHNDSTSTVKTATLEILAEAVAKVKRTNTYFTSLNSAENATYDGAYTDVVDGETSDLISQYKDYRDSKFGFDYSDVTEKTVKDLSGNNYTGFLTNISHDENGINFNNPVSSYKNNNTERLQISENYNENDSLNISSKIYQFDVSANDNNNLNGIVYSSSYNSNTYKIIIDGSNIIYSRRGNYSDYFVLPEDFRDGNIKRVTISSSKVYVDGVELETNTRYNNPSIDTKSYYNTAFIGENLVGNLHNFKVAYNYDLASNYNGEDLKDVDDLLLYYDFTDEANYEIKTTNKLVSNVIPMSYNSLDINKRAVSYIKIDLSNETVRKYLNLDISFESITGAAEVFLEEESDTFNEQKFPDNVQYLSKFIDITFTQNNYIKSATLEPGKVYYLYFYTNAIGEDNRFVINDISMISDETNYNSLIKDSSEDNEFVETTYNTRGDVNYVDSVGNKELQIEGDPVVESDNIQFLNESYGVINGGVDGITTEETIDIEFSTTIRWGWLYQASSKEYLSLYIAGYDELYVRNETSNIYFRLPSSYYDGNKHRLTVTYDYSLAQYEHAYYQRYKVYLDGVAISRSGSRSRTLNRDDNSYIGCDTVTKKSFARIYDLKIYNKALSATDISNNSTEGMLLHYDFSNKTISNSKTITGLGNNYNKAYSRFLIDTYYWTEAKTLTLNAMIFANGYGYASISTSQDDKNLNNAFLRITENVEATDYSVTLQPHCKYYLHLSYFNTTSSAPDYYDNVFIINSIKIDGEDVEFSDINLQTGKIKYVNKTPVLNSELNDYFDDKDNLPADTIMLIKNINLDTKFSVDDTRDVVLDLNGHNLSSTMSDYIIENNGKLKIIDSKYDQESDEKSLKIIDNRNYSVIANLNGYLEVDNVKINVYNTSGINNYAKLKLVNDATINIIGNKSKGIYNKSTGILLEGDGIITQPNTIEFGIGIYNESKEATNSLANYNISGDDIINLVSTEDLDIKNTTFNAKNRAAIVVGDKGHTITLDENVIVNGKISSSFYERKLQVIVFDMYSSDATLIINGSTINDTISYSGENHKVILNGDNHVNKISITKGTLLINNGNIGAISSEDALINMYDGIITPGIVYLTRGSTNFMGGSIIDTHIESYGSNIVLCNNFDITNENEYAMRVSGGEVLIKDNVTINAETSIINLSVVNIIDHVHINGYIFNNGTINIGEKDGNYNSNYPLIENYRNPYYTPSYENVYYLNEFSYVKGAAINSAYIKSNPNYEDRNYVSKLEEYVSSAKLNYYDGKIISVNDYVVVGQITEVEDNHDINISENDAGNYEMILVNPDSNIDPIAKIGNTEYKTLKSAFDSITTSDPVTITLLKNVNTLFNRTINADENITLDLNGNILRTYSFDFIKNNGNFTLTDNLHTGRIISQSTNFINNNNMITLDASVTNTYSNNANIKNTSGNMTITNNSTIAKFSDIRNNYINMFVLGGNLNYSGNSTTANIYLLSDSTLNFSEGSIVNIESYLIDNEATSSILINSGTINTIESSYRCVVNQDEGNSTIIKDIYNGGYLLINDGIITTIENTYSNNFFSNEESIRYAYINGGNIRSVRNKASSTISKSITYIVDGTISFLKNEENALMNVGLPIKQSEDTSYYDEFNNKVYDDEVSTEKPKIIYDGTPAIRRPVYLIDNTGTLNIYDGIFKTKIDYVFKTMPTSTENGYVLFNETNDGYNEIYYLKQLNVAKIGTTEYKTLDEAINACSETLCNIDIINNIFITSSNPAITIPSNKNIKINMNGLSIDSSNETFIVNNGKLTFDDLAPSNSVKANIINNNNLTLNNYVSNKSKITNNNTLNISASSFEYTKLLFNEGSNTIITTSTIKLTSNISSGEINNSGNLEITNSNVNVSVSNEKNALFNITSSTLSKIDNKGIANLYSTTAGIVTNTNVINIKGETSTINNLSNEYYTYVEEADVNELINGENATLYFKKGTIGRKKVTNKGTLNLGLKIKPDIIDSYKDEYDNTIYDDSMNSNYPIIAVNEIENTGEFNIYDGKLYVGSQDIANLNLNKIENEYMLVSDLNQTYNGVSYKYVKYLTNDSVAQIDDTSYSTLEDAFNNCSTNCTIKLLKNVSYVKDHSTITIPNNYDITLDLNGYFIEEDYDDLFVNNGTFKVIDNNDDKTSFINVYYKNFIINNGILTLDVPISRLFSKEVFTEDDNIYTIKNNGSLYLNENCDFKSKVIVSDTVNMHFINSTSNSKIYINGAKISINDTYYNIEYGKSYSRSYSIRIEDGNLFEINDGDITGTMDVISTSMNITGGIINEPVRSYSEPSASINFEKSKNGVEKQLTISGGTFKGIYDVKDSSIVITDGTFLEENNYVTAISIKENSNANISGGTFNKVNISSFDNTIFNLSNGTYNDTYINPRGTSTITGGSYHNSSFNIGGESTINGLTINDNTYINKVTGNLHISNTSITNVDNALTNSGEGVLYLDDNVYIHANKIGLTNGIVVTAIIPPTCVVNMGSNDDPIDHTNPIIIGDEVGIKSIGTSYVNFYSGRAIGKNEAIIGNRVPRSGYYVSLYDNMSDYEGYIVGQLTLESDVELAYIMNNNNYSLLQDAIDDALPDMVNTLELNVPINLSGNITVPDNVTINVITNGNNIDLNGYSFVAVSDQNSIKIYKDSNESDSLLGEILGLFNIGNNSPLKNIAIFNDDNGNTLNSSYEYTLKYNVNGVYEDIDVVEDTLGNYVIATSQSDDKIKTIDGNVYIKNITPGTYSLVSDTGKTSTFTILENGNITGPARITYIDNSKQKGNVLATSNADLIIGLQTGNKVINYGIIILSITILLKVLLTIRKRMN